MSFMKPLPTSLYKIPNLWWWNFWWMHLLQCILWKFPLREIRWNFRILHSASTFDVLLKTLNYSYVCCNEFYKHERLFTIMVQQVPTSWNINLKLSDHKLSRIQALQISNIIDFRENGQNSPKLPKYLFLSIYQKLFRVFL